MSSWFGLITFYHEGDGLTRTRALKVRKMRGTPHSDYLSFFEIAENGIRVVKPEEAQPKRFKKKGP